MLSFDARTESYLAPLNPVFALRLRAFFALVKHQLGYDVYVTSGKRTSAEQAALHAADSRNAKAGTSSHEVGRAIDVNFRKNGVGVLVKSSSAGLWAPVVALAKPLGLRWGGTFTGYADRVHFDDLA